MVKDTVKEVNMHDSELIDNYFLHYFIWWLNITLLKKKKNCKQRACPAAM